jgi:SUKH-3 immunity protein
MEILLQHGWTPGRSIDITEVINCMRSQGYPLLAKPMDFIKEFGLLKIEFINKKSNLVSDINLDPVRAMDIIVREKIVENYAPRIHNAELCIIGTAYNEYLILLMDNDGRVYGVYEDYFVKIADTGTEALLAMINQVKFTEIP